LRSRTGILGIVTSIALLGSVVPAFAAPSPRATLVGSVPPWAKSANFKAAANPSDSIGFRVYLGWSNPSAVEALGGYAIDGETALLVPPGDASALRAAVDRLLGDHELAQRVSAAALERARSWTYRDYFGAVRELIDDALAGRALAPRAPSAPSAPSSEAESVGAARGDPDA